MFTRLYSILPIVTLTFDLQTNRVHSLLLGNICAEFDQNTLHGLISFVFTMLYHFYLLWPWPLKSVGLILSSLATSVLSLIKIHSWFDLYCVHKFIFPFMLWPWLLPQTSKFKSVHPLATVNIYAKFHEVWHYMHYGLASIVFIRSKCGAHTDASTHTYTPTEPQQRYIARGYQGIASPRNPRSAPWLGLWP